MSRDSEVTDLPLEVKSVNTKEQKVFEGISFPLILSPSDTFREKEPLFWNDWVKENINTIENLLLKYGAILFRGFPFDTPKEFDDFSKAYDYNPFHKFYGLGMRRNVVGNVYTTSELPPGGKFPMHHEMAHVRDYPDIVFFYCDLPAKEGGNTPLAPSHIIYRKMAEREPEYVNRLEREGQRYFRIAPDGDDLSTAYGRGWQSTFCASNKEEAERKAKAFGYDFEWQKDGSFKTTTEILPAIRVDKRTGKKMWFNNIFPYAVVTQEHHRKSTIGVTFPNGDAISDETLEVFKQVVDEVKVSFNWQHTDVVLIDNRIVQHAREDFCIPPRRIMVS